MKTILLVFGTRPEAIKMAPLVHVLRQRPDAFRALVCVTGQHRQMLDQVLHFFGIRPDFDLNIMKDGQSLHDVTARVLTGMEGVLKETEPDLMLVHGDTTSALAAALAGFYRRTTVGHVEAGLRTHRPNNPWPEEMNRRLLACLSALHFAPTESNRQNLLLEQVPDSRIIVTGNTVIDALQLAVRRLRDDSALRAATLEQLRRSGYDLEARPPQRRIVLITGHRRENFGSGFTDICRAISTLAQQQPGVDFIYPMHMNPQVREPLHRMFMADGRHCPENLYLIEPLDYPAFVCLMEQASVVLTDSGGIQEEAPGLGKPVLVMRDSTERPEAVNAGTVRLVGTNTNAIVRETNRLLDSPEVCRSMSRAVNPYGDGRAAERIMQALLRYHV